MRLAILAAALLCAACGTLTPPPLTASGVTGSPPTATAAPALTLASSGDPVQQIVTALEKTGPAQINADLTAAGAYAASQHEVLGTACFPALIAWIATLPPLPAGDLAARIASRPRPVGPATAFEYAVVDRMAAEGSVNAWRTQVQTIIATGLPPALKLGCGGYVQDQVEFVNRVAALVGVGATAAALAPAAPALGGLLPIPLTLP